MSTVQPLFGSHVTKRIEIRKPQQSMEETCEGSTHDSGEYSLSIFLELLCIPNSVADTYAI